jgi:hypothetical protein
MKFIVVLGRGDPKSIDAYMYGENCRLFTVSENGRFKSIVVAKTWPQDQADRLNSGLYGTKVFDTAREAMANWKEL